MSVLLLLLGFCSGEDFVAGDDDQNDCMATAASNELIVGPFQLQSLLAAL